MRAVLVAWLVTALGVAAASGGSPPGWPQLTRWKSQGGGGRDAAVIATVERSFAVPEIPGARKNAEAWYDYLTRTRGVPVDRVTLLRDQQVTVGKLRRKLAAAAARSEAGGTLWFVFIGHGAPARSGRDGLLVGADAQAEVDSLAERSLPRSEALRLLAKSRAGRIVAILDACFSGRSSAGTPLVKGLQPLVVEAARAPADERVLVLTAAKGDEFAGALPGLGRPAFSYLALGALRGWADADRNGEVTAAELVEYTGKVLRAMVTGRNQTPTGEGARMTASLGAAWEEGPDIGALVKAHAGPAPRREAPAKAPAASRVVALSTALPKIPEPASSAGGDLPLEADVDVLVAYDKALRAEKEGGPDERAAAWRTVAALEGKNPYRAQATARARAWERYHAAELTLLMEVRADIAKLRKLSKLSVVSGAKKKALAEAFRRKAERLPSAGAIKAWLDQGERKLRAAFARVREGTRSLLARVAPGQAGDHRRATVNPDYEKAVSAVRRMGSDVSAHDEPYRVVVKAIAVLVGYLEAARRHITVDRPGLPRLGIFELVLVQPPGEGVRLEARMAKATGLSIPTRLAGPAGASFELAKAALSDFKQAGEAFLLGANGLTWPQNLAVLIDGHGPTRTITTQRELGAFLSLADKARRALEALAALLTFGPTRHAGAVPSTNLREVSLPEVPEFRSPGLLLEADVDVRVAYDKALRAEKEGGPDERAAAWRTVAALEGKNPYRELATARARAWERYRAAELALWKEFRADLAKFKKLEKLSVVSRAKKKALEEGLLRRVKRLPYFRATLALVAALKRVDQAVNSAWVAARAYAKKLQLHVPARRQVSRAINRAAQPFARAVWGARNLIYRQFKASGSYFERHKEAFAWALSLRPVEARSFLVTVAEGGSVPSRRSTTGAEDSALVRARSALGDLEREGRKLLRAAATVAPTGKARGRFLRLLGEAKQTLTNLAELR